MQRGWTTSPENRRNVQAPLLAGLGLRELRLPEDKGLYSFMEETMDRASRSLVEVIETGALPVGDRLEAGDVLGELGDPRPGSGGLQCIREKRHCGAGDRLGGNHSRQFQHGQ